jgi:hypothetical protein
MEGKSDYPNCNVQPQNGQVEMCIKLKARAVIALSNYTNSTLERRDNGTLISPVPWTGKRQMHINFPCYWSPSRCNGIGRGK